MEKNTRSHQPELSRRPHDAGAQYPPDVAADVREPDNEHLWQALRQAQTNLLRYQELFDFAPDGYLVTDLQGVIQEANHAAAAMLGTSKVFLVDKPLLFYVAESDRRTFAGHLRQLALQNEDRSQWELTLRSPRGLPFYAQVTAASAQIQGHLPGIRWILRDITQRRQAEEALRAQKGFADSLVELADTVILVLSPDGRILRTNRFVLALTGYHRSQVEGRSLADLLVPEDWPAVRHGLDGAVAGLSARGVHRLRTRDGRSRVVAWSARALAPGPDFEPCVLLAGNDITELQEAQRRAVQAERLAAIGEMITGLAHESRNALQRMQSCRTLLSFRIQGQPEALELLDRIQRAHDDLTRLFDEVRAYATSPRLELQTCNLAEVWREAWQDLSGMWAQRDAALREDIRVTDLSCAASPFHLKQVFRNLLDNALSMVTGPVRITIRCTAAEVDGRAALQVAVEDNGPGFPAEQRCKVFEPFVTTKMQGTGLGLAICKRLVEAHGGQIAIGEAQGPGAVITFTIPRRSP